MQLKEINRNGIERKKRLERHKKVIESDIKEVITQEKTTKENLAIKKRTIKKRVIDKKARKDKQKAIAEKAMDDVEKNYLEEEEKSKVVVTKEERAERFKRLHAIAQDTIKKWNE